MRNLRDKKLRVIVHFVFNNTYPQFLKSSYTHFQDSEAGKP